MGNLAKNLKFALGKYFVHCSSTEGGCTFLNECDRNKVVYR